MKTIKILMVCSLIFGFSSVFAQSTDTDIKKTDLEKNTEMVKPEQRSPGETPVGGENITHKTVKKEPSKAIVGRKPGDPDPSGQIAKPNAVSLPKKENSKVNTPEPGESVDPNKL